MTKEESKEAEEATNVALEPDDCAIVLRSNGTVDFLYNLKDPNGKVPGTMIFANGILHSLSDKDTVNAMIKKGHSNMEQQFKEHQSSNSDSVEK